MTVSSALNRKTYTGNGATTSFSTSPVVFYDTDELDVYVVTTATGASTTLTENTHYTVTGGSGAVGTVNLAGGSSPYGAPSASQTLVIVRTLDVLQEFDPENNDGSDADNIETQFDKVTLMIQQNAAAIARALVLADSDVTGVSVTLPTPEASKLLGWNSGLTGLANYASSSISATIVPTAFMETLLDDASAATARATLDAQQDVFTTRGDLVRAGASGVAERVALGASGEVLKSDGTDAVWSADAATTSASGRVELAIQSEVDAGTDASRALTPSLNRISLGTEQATTAGTAIDFTGIPAGTRRITIMFSGVSTSGADIKYIQLGDAGGIESSGYLGANSVLTNVVSTANTTAAFGIASALAADVLHGSVVLTLEDSAGFTWTCSGVLADSTTARAFITAGSKSLSAELTQIRITTTNGTDTFDAGAINIQYER